MAIISQVSFSKLASKLDAEFYQPTYLQVDFTLERLKNSPNFKVTTLQAISTRIRKGIFSILKTEYREDGIPFIRVGNIKNLLIDETRLAHISEEKNELEKKTCLKPKDIVFSKSGTIGAVAIIPPHLPRVNISQDVVGISISKGVYPEYVAAYSASKYGVSQLQRGQSRLTVAHLELHHIRNFLIAIPSERHQHKIADLLNNGIAEVTKADATYDEAQQLLSSYLSLGEHRETSRTYSAKFSDIDTNSRFDAEYFRPYYTALSDAQNQSIEKKFFRTKKLSEVCKITRGVEVGSDAYVEQGGYPFLRVSNISENGPVFEESGKRVRDYVYGNLMSECQPNRGEVLLTKDGAIGTAMVVDSATPECLISSGIVRLKPRSLNPYYLMAVLNSEICRSQTERLSTGTAIKHLPLSDVHNLLIPILSEEKETAIAKLVKKSIERRRDGFKLIRASIAYVEGLIETSR